MDLIHELIKMENDKKQLLKDPYRPKYHFVPPQNWMNDPNGPIYYKGEYHLFYQHNPVGDTWGNIHWGHAKSIDLIYWEHLPIALTPSIEIGEEHCFSGSCVLNKDTPTIVYTSIGPKKLPLTGAEQWLAFSKDDMFSWEKYENNPIMTLEIHDRLKVRDWRDPYIWKVKNDWYAVLSGHIKEKKKPKTPVVLLYHSKDLYKWNFLKPLCFGAKGTGKNWECPNFFDLSDKHVLIVSVSSPKKKVIYSIGTYENREFKFLNWYVLDHGEYFYAPNTIKGPDGRIIMWGWIYGGGNGGWNGCLTLPRELKKGTEDRLLFKPIEELKKLRTRSKYIENFELNSERYKIIEKIEDMCFEFIIELEGNNSGILGVNIVHEENKIIENLLTLDLKTNNLCVGKDNTSILPLEKEKGSKLHVFMDRSVMEVFANYNTCITSRQYFKILEPFDIELQIDKGSVKIRKMKLWPLNHIWA